MRHLGKGIAVVAAVLLGPMVVNNGVPVILTIIVIVSQLCGLKIGLAEVTPLAEWLGERREMIHVIAGLSVFGSVLYAPKAIGRVLLKAVSWCVRKAGWSDAEIMAGLTVASFIATIVFMTLMALT